MDFRGIASYLLIAYGLAFGIEALILSQGWITYQNRDEAGFPVFWGLLLIPGIAGLLASILASGETIAKSAFWPIPWGRVAQSIILGTAVIAATYAIEIATGVTEPDWELSKFRELLPTAQEMNSSSELPSAFLIVMTLLINVFLVVVAYGPLFMVSEYGWRGFLQPRLERLGALRAYLLVGLLWGAWFTPIVFSKPLSSAEPWSTLTRVIIMAILFSIILGELYRRTGSLWPGAVLCGTFMSHNLRFSAMLMVNEKFPWGGPMGYISTTVWLVTVLTLYCFRDTLIPRRNSTAGHV